VYNKFIKILKKKQQIYQEISDRIKKKFKEKEIK